jgi:hypothetical protein
VCTVLEAVPSVDRVCISNVPQVMDSGYCNSVIVFQHVHTS